MGLLRLISTLCLVIFVQSGSTSLAQTDPFSSPSVLSRSDPLARKLSGEAEIRLQGSVAKLSAELTFDVGTVRASASHLIEIELEDELGIELTYSDISSSCGCLGGLPKDANFDGDTPLVIRAVFTPPRESGEFKKMITLVDSKNQAKVLINLTGQSEEILAFENTSFTVSGTGRQTFKTGVTFPFSNELDPDTFIYRIGAPFISGYRVEKLEDGSGVFTIDLVTSEEDRIGKTVPLTVLNRQGKILGEVPLHFRMGYVPASRPSRIALREQKNGTLVGRAVIQLIGLSEPDEVRRTQVMVQANSRSNSEERSFPCEVLFVGKLSPLTVVELTLRDPGVIKSPNDWSLSIQFSGKDDSLTVPVEIYK